MKDCSMPRERNYTSPRRTAFHHEAGENVLSQVERHWRDMRKGADVPDRVDLTPAPLSDALAHCFTLERVTPTVARFRVAGRNVHKLLNMEPRGMPISALFTPLGREMLAPIIFDVCETPEITEIPLVAHRGFGRTPLRGRLLLLPLKQDSEEVNRLFGALVVDGRSGRRPLRFDFDQEQSLRVQSVRPIIRTIHEVMDEPITDFGGPGPTPAFSTQTPVLAFESETTTVSTERSTTSPALRLVVDNS
jgi:hypothetical protein